MKRIIVVIIMASLAWISWAASPAAPAGLRPGLFELGVNLGEPTGVSAKVWLDRTNALEGIGAWAFSQGAFAFSVDYLINFNNVLTIKTETFPLFVGIGGIVRISAGALPGVTAGLRVPLGVLYIFRNIPLEISLDIVPGVNLFPDTTFLAMGGLALRYCF